MLSLKNARKGMNDSAQLEIKNHGKSGKITRELSRNHHLLKATLLPEERGGKFLKTILLGISMHCAKHYCKARFTTAN